MKNCHGKKGASQEKKLRLARAMGLLPGVVYLSADFYQYFSRLGVDG